MALMFYTGSAVSRLIVAGKMVAPRRALDILICSGDDLQTRASHRGAVQDPARGEVMWMPGEAAETRADAARLAQKRLTPALDGATAVYRRLTPSSPEVQANYMARSTV